MSLRSGNIPSLVQGVSQQPATLRLPTQLELQENCHSSVVEGLIRRPPTEHIAKVSDSSLDGAFHHTINRDTTERYNVIVTTSGVRVFDLEGVEKTVNYQDAEVFLLADRTGVVNGNTNIIAPAPGETSLDFNVTGITTATVKLQLSVDGSSWSDASTRTSNGTNTGVSIGSNVYMRVIISAYTSGTITAKVTYKHTRYLQCSSPKTELRAITIADFTFLVNSTVIPSMKNWTSAKSPTRPHEGLIFVKAGNYGSRYQININGGTVTWYDTSTTDVEDISTHHIISELQTGLSGFGYNVSPWIMGDPDAGFTSSVLYLANTSTDFQLNCLDSHSGQDMQVFKDAAASFTELPTFGRNGFVIAIDANPETSAGKYYLKAVTTQSGVTDGEITWQETVKPGIEIEINPATMPQTLVRQEDGTFLFKETTWDNRLVGDETTNELPSFIGSPINDIIFYKNRIGFLADEYFVFSETGSYFNFFRTTVTQLLDTDPVDSRAVNTKVSILKHAVPFNTDLILFSDQTQFKIPGDVALTPKTVRCDPAAEFEGNLITKPVNSGKTLFFIFNREDYAGLKELFWSPSITNKMDATDLTAHVPSYMPSGVFSMAASTLDGTTVMLTDNDPSAIYVYKTAFQPGNNDQKIQAAWYRWTLGDEETTVVLSAKFIESTLHILVERDGKVYQERMILQPSRVDSGSTYVTHLDRRFDESFGTVTATYDINTNTSLFSNLPYAPDANTMIVTKGGTVLQIADSDATSLTVFGEHHNDEVWIGQTYLSRAQPSTIYIRKQTSNGGTTIDEASRLQLLRGYFNYADTGYFKVSVTPEGRDTSEYVFSGKVAGSVTLGSVSLRSGRFSFGIFSKNDRVTIEVSSDSFLPFAITSMEWEGGYTKRSGG